VDNRILMISPSRYHSKIIEGRNLNSFSWFFLGFIPYESPVNESKLFMSTTAERYLFEVGIEIDSSQVSMIGRSTEEQDVHHKGRI